MDPGLHQLFQCSVPQTDDIQSVSCCGENACVCFGNTLYMLSLYVPPGSSAHRSPTKSCRALASLTHRVSCLEKNNVLAEVSTCNAFLLVLFKCSDVMIMWSHILFGRSQQHKIIKHIIWHIYIAMKNLLQTEVYWWVYWWLVQFILFQAASQYRVTVLCSLVFISVTRYKPMSL